jgi:hypothetical protein
LHGNQWGIKVDVVKFEPGIPLVGNRTYYRVESAIGFKDGVFDPRPFSNVTDKIWAELAKANNQLTGVGNIEEHVRFRDPAVGADFVVSLDEKKDVQIAIKDKEADNPATETQP